jgi:hypothetical protein
MSIDTAITEAVAVALAPVLTELREMRAELADVRASLLPRFVSLKQAASAIGVDPRTLTAMAERGEIIVRRAGRRVLVDAASLRPTTKVQIAELARIAREPRP